MKFKDIEELTRIINTSLDGFCSIFQYKRKELFGLGRVAIQNRLFEFIDPKRTWVINKGGGTEIQFHLFFEDNSVGYGLGFNTQYVPHANEKSTVDWMKPYADSFLSQPQLLRTLQNQGFEFVYGNETELRQLRDDNYVLIGKEIDVEKVGQNFEMPEQDFQQMISDLKGILFDTYISVAARVNRNGNYTSARRYSIEEFEQLFKDFLQRIIPNSASNYLSAVPTINRIGKRHHLVIESLYELQELNAYSGFYDVIKNDEEYTQKNTTGHNMYHSSLKKYREFLQELNLTYAKTVNLMENTSLNQILYGPPGTGKTYNSITRALQIIQPTFESWQDRTAVKTAFDNWQQQSRVLFTTFHQSMSYEDFVEGIKPQKPLESGNVPYDIEPGLFKIACARAAYLCYKKYNQEKGVKKAAYTFDDLYDAFLASIKERITKESFPTYKTITGKEVEIYEINSQNSIKARAKDSQAIHVAPLTEENLEKLYDKFSDISEIQSLSQVRETTQVRPRSTEFYAVFGGIKSFEKTFQDSFQPATIEEDLEEIDTTEDAEKIKKFSAGIYHEAMNEVKDAEPVVLILDEINRGNVSQIFGELITLIEEDKRIGKPESVELILQYSKTKFGVPPNLHIVGTMNTADRSVEALDTALRRRFKFEEITPNYTLPELNYPIFGIKTFDLLQTINKRIEKLLDKDHLIGHSYFILQTGNDIHKKTINTFYENIIPLLQEYFFGDFGKIGLILGKGFINLKSWDEKSDSFAEFDHESAADFSQKEVFEIIDYRTEGLDYQVDKVKMNFEKAIHLLMKKAIA